MRRRKGLHSMTGCSMYNYIMLACKAAYHPRQKLSIDERMLATKARLGFKQYLPLKPTKWGIKLFVLADMHGYTWKYFIYEGKTAEQLTDGLGYSAVMRLLERRFSWTIFTPARSF